MSWKIWLFNLALAAAVVMTGAKARDVWSEVDRRPVEAGTVARPLPVAGKEVSLRHMPDIAAYEAIEAHNLFSPSRKPPQEAVEAASASADDKPVPPPPPPDKIYLNGVILSDEYKGALVRDLQAKPGQRQERWVSVGDSVEGFKVAAIARDRIVLEGPGGSYEIMLHDRGKPRVPMRPSSMAGAPTVVAVGAAPPPPPSPARPTTAKAEKKKAPNVFGPFPSKKEKTSKEVGKTQGVAPEVPKNPFAELLRRFKVRRQEEGLDIPLDTLRDLKQD